VQVASSQSNLELLHDHYKETFSLILARERRRDRFLLWLLFLFAVLILEIQYPVDAHGALGSITILGNTINLHALPLALLLNASWFLVAAILLKWCQLTTSVERQYDFLHLLEDRISDALGDDDVYRREGRVYLSKYPRLLNWAWLSYVYLIPVGLFAGTIYLYTVEARSLPYSVPSKVIDGLFASLIVISLFLYRFIPLRSPMPAESYLDEVGAAISHELPKKDSRSTPPDLLRLYAVLLLAKGVDVTAEDVHNAWSAWMQDRGSNDASIKPFAELDESVKQRDNPFVAAIRRAAEARTSGG